MVGHRTRSSRSAMGGVVLLVCAGAAESFACPLNMDAAVRAQDIEVIPQISFDDVFRTRTK